MGRMLGAFDGSNDIDRPELNKCPDCGCYFDQDNCPLCGKECPTEFRAGNRKAVKPIKWKRSSGGTAYLEWYQQWWFLILLLFIVPLAGWIISAILFFSSPRKNGAKIALSLVIIALIILFFVFINSIEEIGEPECPIDTSLSPEEYIAACETVSPENYYRYSTSYEDKLVSITLTVRERIVDSDDYYYYESDKYAVYYICSDDLGTVTILVRDCLQDAQNFVVGDVITVYGEGAGNQTICNLSDYEEHSAPCVYAAYAVVDTPR